MKPRPYQAKALECIQSAFKEFKRLLAVLPTGSGKTIIFAWLAQLIQPKRTLILCHREELINQARDKIWATTGIVPEIEKAEQKASVYAPIVVASVQTMIRRLDRWPSNHFHLVVADEAHHAISESWQGVLSHFEAHVLGCTATPDRGDKRTLAEYFESVAIDVPLIELIKERFLCPITIKSLPLKIDLSKVRLLAGDFNDKQLGHILEPYLDDIAWSIRKHASFRKVLAFLPLIATSHKFVDACRNVGLVAQHVDGGSPDRQEILARYAAGEFDVLSNAMLLTEGYDDPTIDCVVVLRPTRSRPLFAQMVGRGTRIHETKDNLLLLDFLWLHEKHRIVHPADLLAKEREDADRATDMAAGAGEERDLVDLYRDAVAEREATLRERLERLAKRKAKYISAEQFCMSHDNFEAADYQPTMHWETQSVTEKQAKYLEEANIDIETVRGRGHASVLLDMVFQDKDLELASHKQRWAMYQRGHPDPWKATKSEARQFFADVNRKR
jgi:superfamily II DNA or RNA helicase